MEEVLDAARKQNRTVSCIEKVNDEEAGIVVKIVHDLLQSGVAWIDMHGETRSMTINDILIVSPYNAQVFSLAARLPNARIGTVDKFQGQEAPVVIYSMATSSPEDAPRGMEFLYSANPSLTVHRTADYSDRFVLVPTGP